MKTFVKFFLGICAGIMVLGGLLFGLGLTIGGRLSYYFDFDSKEFSNVVLLEDSGDLADFNKIDMHLSTLDLEIKKGDKCGYEYVVQEGFEPTIKVENDTLIVEQTDKPQFLLNINMVTTNESQRIIVYVTDDQEVNINCTSGDVTIDGVNVTGNVVSTSGDMCISNSVGDDLKVKSTSGDIHLNDLEYKALTTDQTSGDLSLKQCKIDELDSEFTSGESKIDNVECEKFNSHGTSGSQKFTSLKADEFKTKVTSGEIYIIGSEFDTLTASVGSGELNVSETTASKADLSTTTGSLKADFKGDISEYTIDGKTTAGSIYVNGDSKGNKYTASGSTDKYINVKVTTGEVKLNVE